MVSLRWLAALVVFAFAATCPARAAPFRSWFWTPDPLNEVNARLKGHVLDYTRNHRGPDRRMPAPSLEEKRDLYVYVPPNYDRCLHYPVMYWLHGIAQDETAFLDIVDLLDKAIAKGELPPMIIAAPDGSLIGKPSLFRLGSFYVNSRAGNYEEFLAKDVWDFLNARFRIRPERDAHVMAGGSMGGFGAVNHAFKYKSRWGILAAFQPPLNLRYIDCNGDSLTDYNPNCVAVRDRMQPYATVARFGAFRVQQRRLCNPLFGRGPDAIDHIARENPIEMLGPYCIGPDTFQFFIAYGGKDEINIDAQVEHFLDVAKTFGIRPDVSYDPLGKHGVEEGKKHFPNFVQWLGPRLWPYSPVPPPAAPGG